MKQTFEFEALQAALAEVHDCPFELDQAKFDLKRGEWHGKFLLPVWDSPVAAHIRRWLFIVESRLPIVERNVFISGVTACRVRDEARMGCYTFTWAHRTQQGLQLEFNEGLEIELDVNAPINGGIDDEAVSDRIAVYRQYFIVQTGPHIEFSPR